MGVYVTNALSKDNRGGNKTGMVLQQARLNEAEKAEITLLMRYSETAFVVDSELVDFKLECFTSMGEVPLCGHATTGTFTVLRYSGRLEEQEYTIEIRSDVLRIRVDKSGLTFMEQSIPEFYKRLDKGDVKIYLDSDGIPGILPAQIISTGLKGIILPVTDPETLGRMTSGFSAITRLSRERECIDIHAFSLAKEMGLTVICRNFAPLCGIDEESVADASNCALAYYLYRYISKQDQYISEQGHNLNSISRIHVNLDTEDNTATGVRVGGCGCLSCLS